MTKLNWDVMDPLSIQQGFLYLHVFQRITPMVAGMLKYLMDLDGLHILLDQVFPFTLHNPLLHRKKRWSIFNFPPLLL